MFKKANVLFLVFLSTLSSAHATSKHFIYDGERVLNDTQFPFVVAIYDKYSSDSVCTGTLIGHKWVLTAQHCVDEQDKPSDYVVGFGHKARNKATAQKVVNVKGFFMYKDPGDEEPFRIVHDIALLELSETVDIKPVNLPSSPDAFPNLKSGEQSATEVGYGWTNIFWPPICETEPASHDCWSKAKTVQDEYLHFGEILIQPDITIDSLLKMYKALENISESDPYFPIYNLETMIGATSPKGQRATSGDSGGPILIEERQNSEEKKYIQVGTASWTFVESYASFKQGYFYREPVVYASLLNNDSLNFIKKIMNENP